MIELMMFIAVVLSAAVLWEVYKIQKTYEEVVKELEGANEKMMDELKTQEYLRKYWRA